MSKVPALKIITVDDSSFKNTAASELEDNQFINNAFTIVDVADLQTELANARKQLVVWEQRYVQYVNSVSKR